MPGILRYARAEGLYRSDSVLLLLSVPVAVWNLIPKDPAVRFLSFVRSPNLLLTQDDMKSPSPTKSAVVHSQRVRKSYLSLNKRRRDSSRLTPQPSRMDLGLSELSDGGTPGFEQVGYLYDTHHCLPGSIYQVPTIQSTIASHLSILREAIRTYDRPMRDELCNHA